MFDEEERWLAGLAGMLRSKPDQERSIGQDGPSHAPALHPHPTIGTYCKLDVHDSNGVVERLPDLASEDDSTRESMAATGTDGDHISGRFGTHLPLTGDGNGRDVSDLGGINHSTPEALASPAMSRNPLETDGLDASCRDLSLAGGTEGVGFEPTDVSRRQRFSRPSRSTTPAPLLDSDDAMLRVRLLADLVDDILGHEDRDVDRHGDGDGVARPGVDLDQLAVVPDPELGVVGVVAQLADEDVLELAAEQLDGVGQEVVGQGTGAGSPFTRRSILVASKMPMTIGNVRSPSTSFKKMICCSLFSLMMIRVSSI